MNKKGAAGAAATAVATVKAGVKALRMAFRAAHRGLRLLIALGPIPILLVIVVVSMMAAAGGAVALGEKLVGFAGITKDHLTFLEDVDPELVEELREEYGDDYAEALDCSNFPPSERQPGINCIEGLLDSGEDPSAIPKSAYWLIPAWKQAANRYQLDWRLLAAINGARSKFGKVNCTSDQGVGFYRLNERAWREYRVNAGSSKLERSLVGCYEASEPIKIRDDFKKPFNKGDPENFAQPEEADYFDATDSIFTQARLIAKRDGFGAMQKGWDYSGSPSKSCTADPSDGRVFYAPEFASNSLAGVGGLSSNKKLELPQWIIAHSAKWRKANDPSTSAKAMDSKMLMKYLVTVWEAFGADRGKAEANAKLNMQMIMGESGGRPAQIQTIQDINSGGNEAGGLFQFVKGTFDVFAVDGFNDRFAPLDNILAAVNAQTNGGTGGTVLSNAGWSPDTTVTNQYATGGQKANVSNPTSKNSKPVNAHPYKGKPQDDVISQAVAWDGTRTMSECYVAVVNDWYEAIKKYPPVEESTGDSSAYRNEIVRIAQKELKRGVHETGGNNVPRYDDTGKIAPYNINTFWCAAFSTWVWSQAGLTKEVESMTNPYLVLGPDGLQGWAESKDLWKDDNPLPGDMIIYGGSGHVGLVEKVKGGKVVSSIEGNASDAVIRVPSPTSQIGYISVPGGAGKAPGGAYAGSKAIVEELVKEAGVFQGDGKRTPEENGSVGGSTTSMHLTTNKEAYAEDFAYDQKILDVITKNLKLNGRPRLPFEWEGSYKGYAIELIASDHGTGPHIHLGAQWTGGPIAGDDGKDHHDGGAEDDKAGKALVVGDSLQVGTGPTLKDIMGSKVTVNAESGRSSSQGLNVLKNKIDGSYKVVVFDLGSNDGGSVSTLKNNLKAAQNVAGKRCLVVATLNGRNSGDMNKMIHNFAEGGGVELINWAAVTSNNPGLLSSDGLHATPDGYKVRAKEVAQSIRRC